MQGEERMGERDLTPGRGGSLWGSPSRHQGQGVVRGCGTCTEGPACSRSCPLCAPHPRHHLHGVREQAARPDHFKGPVLAAWPLCFVGRRERTEGAEGCVHSGCGRLALLTVPGSPGQGRKDDSRAGQTFAGRTEHRGPIPGG